MFLLNSSSANTPVLVKKWFDCGPKFFNIQPPPPPPSISNNFCFFKDDLRIVNISLQQPLMPIITKCWIL